MQEALLLAKTHQMKHYSTLLSKKTKALFSQKIYLIDEQLNYTYSQTILKLYL